MAAVELPPRRSRQFPEVTIRRNRSSLEILMQMGFPKPRAEKALAATGDKGVQAASDWLLSHVSDPTLDEKTSRDYVLYLCPVGPLQHEFLDFWQESYQHCGWNRAHNYFPHITLCSFFKADDNQVSKLSHALKTVTERLGNLPDKMEMDYFSSTNFIGLFIADKCASLLRQITAHFAEEVRKIGVIVEPHKKQLHISLAYQFPTDAKDQLEPIAKNIDCTRPVRWDLRLYSQDPRNNNSQVQKVICPHTPRAPDELELELGDFIFVSESELENSPDGWFQGTSWLSGCTGMFPGTYAERCAESETWTMHRSIPIVGYGTLTKAEANGPLPVEDPHSSQITKRMWSSVAAAVPGTGNSPSASTSAIAKPSRPPVPTPRSTHTDSPKFEKRPSNASMGNGLASSGDSSSSSSSSSSSGSNRTAVVDGTRPKITNLCQGPPNPAAAAAAGVSQQAQQTVSSSSSSSSAASLHSLQNSVHEDDDKTVIADGQSTSPRQARRSLVVAEDKLPPVLSHGGPRQLYVVRHGERIDFTFGKDWIKNSFDHRGNYMRYDLNMPKSLPKRRGGPQDFLRDSPLTVQGHFQARLVGEAMRDQGLSVAHVYSSASLRCVETAASILQGLQLNLPISAEPGLFEWLGWYTGGLPAFMTPDELHEAGFNVNMSYEPFCPVCKYNRSETTEQYYERSYQATRNILQRHEHEGGNVLLVGHAASLDTCTRQMVGQQSRSMLGFQDMLHKIPYCALCVAQEACLVRDTWYLIEPPILPFAHTNNPKYNWTCLTNPNMG